MARGYRHGGTSKSLNILKIHWAGAVDGISWVFSKNTGSSDGAASYSIGERVNSSVSGYYATSSLCSSKINVTNYSKLHITIPASSGNSSNGTWKVGISKDIGINETFEKFLNAPGANNYIIDISDLQGIYYFKIYENSGNRYSKSISVSHIWLEK